MKDLTIAIELCSLIYELNKDLIFPALTGGTLYKEGESKDIDIVVYQKRPIATMIKDVVDVKAFMTKQMHNNQPVTKEYFDFVTSLQAASCMVAKGVYKGINIDILYPESQEGDYQ